MKATQTAIIWEGDSPRNRNYQLCRTLQRSMPFRKRAAQTWREKRRSRYDLSAHDPRSRLCHAGLRPHRRGSLGGFAGFSPDSLRDRILDCDSSLVITADEGLRGGRKVPLKKNVDEALQSCPRFQSHRRSPDRGGIAWNEERDVWLHRECLSVDSDCPAEEMNAEDPMFILYTSGSTASLKAFCTPRAAIFSMLPCRTNMSSTITTASLLVHGGCGWCHGHSYVVMDRSPTARRR